MKILATNEGEEKSEAIVDEGRMQNSPNIQ